MFLEGTMDSIIIIIIIIKRRDKNDLQYYIYSDNLLYTSLFKSIYSYILDKSDK